MNKKVFCTGLVVLALLMMFVATNSASAHWPGRGYYRPPVVRPYYAPRHVHVVAPAPPVAVAPVVPVRPYYRPRRVYAAPPSSGLQIVTPRAAIGIQF